MIPIFILIISIVFGPVAAATVALSQLCPGLYWQPNPWDKAPVRTLLCPGLSSFLDLPSLLCPGFVQVLFR